jgi:hypothetical protein
MNILFIYLFRRTTSLLWGHMAWSLVLSHLFVHSSRIFIHILTALSHLWRNKNKNVAMLRFRKLKLTMHSFNSTNIRYHDFFNR